MQVDILLGTPDPQTHSLSSLTHNVNSHRFSPKFDSFYHIIYLASLTIAVNINTRDEHERLIVECNKYFMRTKEPLPKTVADNKKKLSIRYETKHHTTDNQK